MPPEAIQVLTDKDKSPAVLQEALFGNIQEVRLRSRTSLGTPKGKIPQFARALNFAFAGDTTRAQLLADDLAKRDPTDTLVQFNLLPTIRAQIALGWHDPSRAVDVLQVAAIQSIFSYVSIDKRSSPNLHVGWSDA